MENQPQRREIRHDEISDRITAIRTRINDLRQPWEDRASAASGERLAEAQHHAADSRTTAQQALASSIQGLLRAAQAHERCAISHERLAAAPDGDKELHRRQAAHHWAAAAVDRQRAETAQSLFSSRAEDSQSGRHRPASEQSYR